ncbi:GPI anchored cell wall [Lecanosticta acicola]|uniref:GPI anchored cell wall n=1 Tax=Lecanosticta acicola TaxID=111012 RepID=A0AAI9EFI3_9PEZI|nr:GPI anchored cell wall [Lecanosticta acicola]
MFFFVIASLASASRALALTVPRDTGCCFHASAPDGPGSTVGQLSDGQNRLNQPGLDEGQYCFGSNGGLTDSNGRGCVITAPTGQWQCDVGATPTPGWSVGTNGSLALDDKTEFYACPTGDNGGYNVYNKPVDNQQGCVSVWLKADNCAAPAPAPPSPAPAPTPSECPADLPDDFEYPHLIIPIDSAQPNTCQGTQYNGIAGGTVSSIFNFDIPVKAKGRTCKVKFLFPKQAQLQTSSYAYTAPGVFQFAQLSGPASNSTTFASSPKVTTDFGQFAMQPGNTYDIASFDCPSNEVIAIWMHAIDGAINYFQDYNPCRK